MGALRPVLFSLGILLTLMGLLWIGQGLGYIDWPASSFMLRQRVWADYGAAMSVAGLLMLLVGRRLPRR